MSVGNVGGPGDIDFTQSISPSVSNPSAADPKKNADRTPDVAARNAQTVGREVASFFSGPRLSANAKGKLSDLILGNDNESGPRNLGNA